MNINNRHHSDIFKLPYKFDSLEPYISAKTNEHHYNEHFSNYVKNMYRIKNEKNVFEDRGIKDTMLNSYGILDLVDLYNNASQVYNHILFWSSLCVPNSEDRKYGEVTNHYIENSFTSFENMRNIIIDEALSLFGSGWIFLVLNDKNKLEIMTTVNAFNPLVMSNVKDLLFGIDMWEHAYYLDYASKRKDYILNVFDNLINWSSVEDKLQAHIV